MATAFARMDMVADDDRNTPGFVRPYRACPTDFRERFLEMGWDGIAEHYRASWRCVLRWIEECGGETLRAERRKITGATPRKAGHSRDRARRYVMGQTLKGRGK